MEFITLEHRLYDAKEIATMLGLHLRTVQLLFRRGRISGMKIGRTWKAYDSDLQAYLDTQRQAAIAATAKEAL